MPPADPIVAAAAGNLSPTAPGLTGAAAGGNLAPTAPSAETVRRAAVQATLLFLNAGEVAENSDQVVIGGIEYSTATTPANPYDVGPPSVANWIAAINGTDGRSPANPAFTASDATGGDILLTARAIGAAGNGISGNYLGAETAPAFDQPSSAEGFSSGGVDAYPVSGTPAATAAAGGANLAPTAPGAITA